MAVKHAAMKKSAKSEKKRSLCIFHSNSRPLWVTLWKKPASDYSARAPFV
jgi:hypothetical protein